MLKAEHMKKTDNNRNNTKKLNDRDKAIIIITISKTKSIIMIVIITTVIATFNSLSFSTPSLITTKKTSSSIYFTKQNQFPSGQITRDNNLASVYFDSRLSPNTDKR